MHHYNTPARITESDLEEMKACLNKIRSRIPASVTLTSAERRRMFKMGDKSVAFVENCLTTAQNHPEVLVRAFHVAEYERIVRLAAALRELRMEVEKLATEVDDTTLAVNAEALQQSLYVYGAVKVAAHNVPGMRVVAEQLGARFARPARTEEAAASKDEHPAVTHEAGEISDEVVVIAQAPETFTDQSRALDDASRRSNGESQTLKDASRRGNDAARRCNGEFLELADAAHRGNGECLGLDDGSGSASDAYRRGNSESRRLGDEFRRCTDKSWGVCNKSQRLDLERPGFIDEEGAERPAAGKFIEAQFSHAAQAPEERPVYRNLSMKNKPSSVGAA